MATTFRPMLEELNTRTLPSTAIAAPVATVVQTLVANPSHPLTGSGHGSYYQPFTIDSGVNRRITGDITLAGLGSFHVTGWLQGTGFVNNGRATGQLVLTNAQGSITLNLHGAPQTGFSPIPATMVYTIANGTGAYATAKGYGAIETRFTPAPYVAGIASNGIFTMKAV